MGQKGSKDPDRVTVMGVMRAGAFYIYVPVPLRSIIHLNVYAYRTVQEP